METILCCPCSYKEKLRKVESSFVCTNVNCMHSNFENAFPVVNEIPILISDTRTDTVCSLESGKTYVERPLAKYTKLKKLMAGDCSVTLKNCRKFVDLVSEKTDKAKILVIGGGEKGFATEELWGSKACEIVSIDIYASSSTDIVCDAHYLPFNSNTFDGVWIQAVLEHVVEPAQVVSEIYRVLDTNGLVYAETPFMQQVHEGAYDFTRYTVLGHRYLFKDFEMVGLGGNKGPEVVFTWSVRYFVWALTRNRFLARISGLFLSILMRPFSYFMSKKSMFDASSGVFFMGRKLNEKKHLSHKDLVALYKGQF